MNTKNGVSSDLLRALTILPIMDKQILIFLYVFGVVGSLLNISTLFQKKFRKNSCSSYFLFASLTDFFIMNGVLITDAFRYLNPSLFVNMNSNIFWCKFGKFLIFLLPCLSSTFITLASVDRFCTSSNQIQLRKLSQLKVSRILIPVVVLIWFLFSLHIVVLYEIDANQVEKCRARTTSFLFILIVDGFFFSLFNGAVVPILLCSFGFLIHRNVRTSRQRIGPSGSTENSNLNRQNLHLITMVLVQSSLTVFLNIPYMTIYLNSLYNNVPTNASLLLVYAVFTYVARWFWFANFVKTFYLNTLSSQIFRNTFKKQFHHFNRQSIGRLRTRIGI